MKEKVERLDDFGRGIIYLNGKISFIPDVLVGEEVIVKDYMEYKKYNVVTDYEIIKSSSKRIDNKCPYNKECGGCQLLHMSYQNQLDFKHDKVSNIMKRFANIDNSLVGKVCPSIEFNYRNKIVLTVEEDRLGFYKDKSNELVDIEKCLLVNDKINDFILKLRVFIKSNLSLTKVMIRLIDNKLIINFEGEIDKEVLVKYFNKIVASIYLNNEHVSGETQLEKGLLEMRFISSPQSFFQVNDYMTKIIYQKVIDSVVKLKSKSVIDLYCGTGTIGLLVSKYVNKVLGIDSVREAIDDALINKELNNITNTNFKCGKVENFNLSTKYDTVIVDPPRKGLDKKVVNNLLENEYKNIIYVSCDPITLARDIKLLSDKYDVSECSLYDMFPNTYHVECLVTLCRK